jgi:hypothetical protein
MFNILEHEKFKIVTSSSFSERMQNDFIDDVQALKVSKIGSLGFGKIVLKGVP